MPINRVKMRQKYKKIQKKNITKWCLFIKTNQMYAQSCITISKRTKFYCTNKENHFCLFWKILNLLSASFMNCFSICLFCNFLFLKKKMFIPFIWNLSRLLEITHAHTTVFFLVLWFKKKETRIEFASFVVNKFLKVFILFFRLIKSN